MLLKDFVFFKLITLVINTLSVEVKVLQYQHIKDPLALSSMQRGRN